MSVEDILRMIAPAVARRRVRRGMRWVKNPSGTTNFSDQFLIAHGFMPDEIAPRSVLAFVWDEMKKPAFEFAHS